MKARYDLSIKYVHNVYLYYFKIPVKIIRIILTYDNKGASS